MQSQANRKNNHLEEAITLLIHNQAAFVAQLAESNRDIAASNRNIEESKKETERTIKEIRADFGQIKAMLLRHERILSELPEAIRQKIGFQPS